jgi:hypothetical protein
VKNQNRLRRRYTTLSAVNAEFVAQLGAASCDTRDRRPITLS